MTGMAYELLLRIAFGYVSFGRVGHHGCDPAKLTDRMLYVSRNFSEVKIAAGYAMQILISEVTNVKAGFIYDSEVARLKMYAERVVGSNTLLDLDFVINEFHETVVEKYFSVNDGHVQVK